MGMQGVLRVGFKAIELRQRFLGQEAQTSDDSDSEQEKKKNVFTFSLSFKLENG